MPLLDVTDLLSDPDFCERLVIVRRFEDFNDDGVLGTQDQLVRPKPFGSVQPQSDATMVRGPDQQALPSLIQIHTRFPLRGVTDDHQPDKVYWSGAEYTINKVQPWAAWGRGMFQADASITSTTAKPPKDDC